MTAVRSQKTLLAPLAVLAMLGVVDLAHADLGPKGTTLGAGVSSGGTTVGPSAEVGPAAPNALAKAAAEKKSITLGDDSGKSKSHNLLVPPTHTVHKGDTLWDICEHYFGNPWQWPRVWSYNPEILNPHWIYPGELVRLKKEGGITPASSNTMTAGGVVLKPKLVPTGTVFLRNYGFIYDSDLEDTGEIIGSPEEKMLLTTFDAVYVRVTKDQADKLYPGDTITVFQGIRPVKKGDSVLGNVVQILGTVKVDTIDKKKNFVEGTIIESLDVIERGARVGPVERKIDVVPPKTNDLDLRGVVLSSIHANVLYGANQVVLIDKGEDDGLRSGNRLFVVRKGDPWRTGLSSTGALAAGKLTVSSDGAQDVANVDTQADNPDYPEEVIAEVRVVRVRKKTATCLVTNSHKEIEPGDTWVLKKGY